MGVPHLSNRAGHQARSWSRRGILAALAAAPAAAALAGTLDSARTKWTSVRNPRSGTEYTVTAKAGARPRRR